MKEKLLERLKLMDEAVAKQNEALQKANAVLQQANADLNVLNGCRQELVHVINMCDAPPHAECVAVMDDCVDKDVKEVA